jgi:uncharacterized membrane protein YphA (DoxX/SURF4 family)/peroxiredoxin
VKGLSIVEVALLADRILLAAVFLIAGATKLANTSALQQVLPEFGIPLWMSRPFAISLPLLELAVAALLIPANFAWFGAWGAAGLLIVFAIVATIMIGRGRKPDCNCFGQLHSAPIGWPVLVRNVLLASCASWIVIKGRMNSGPELWTWFASLNSNGRKAAIVAGCTIGFCFFYLLDRARPKAASSDAEEESQATATPGTRSQVDVEPRDPDKPPAMGIGLPIGTPAPEFELRLLSGEKQSLQALRASKAAVLIFSSPYCGSCAALTSELVRWMREMEGLPEIILISRGTVKDNLAKFKGFEPSRILLQREFEVSEAYDCTSTPSAVLVGADGSIGSELAVGGAAIEQLLSSYARRDEQAQLPF